VDYLGLSIPIVGDALDLLMALLLGFTVNDFRASVGPLLEIIPGADLLPLNILSALWAYWRFRGEGLD